MQIFTLNIAKPASVSGRFKCAILNIVCCLLPYFVVQIHNEHPRNS